MKHLSKATLVTLGLCLALVVGSPAPTQAATLTSNLSVSATVTTACSSITTSAVNFGTAVAGTSTAVTTSTGVVTISCTGGTPISVALDQGANPATGSTATAPLRQMASGTSRLSYNLYQDGAFTTVWGSGTAAQPFTLLVGTTAVTLTAFGKIATVPSTTVAGTYSDTVVVTVTF